MIRFRMGFRTYSPDLPPPPEETPAGPHQGLYLHLKTKCAKRNRPIVIALEDLVTKDQSSSRDDASASGDDASVSEDDTLSSEDSKAAPENDEPPNARSQSWKTTNSFRPRRLIATGSLNGKSLDAVADSGASFNVISQELADTLGLSIDQASVTSVCLPSGALIRTLGKTAGLFEFSGEEKQYPLPCIVLEKCIHSLVLGSHFLRVTQTLTEHTGRIKKVFSNVLSLNFLGALEAEQNLLVGYLNGQLADVVPDTGSDIMVMSLSFAEQLGLTINKTAQDRVKVQFIDGSEAYTMGKVREVQWAYRKYVLDHNSRNLPKCGYEFCIIQNLPVDALVSSKFIDESGVYSAYTHHLISRKPKDFRSGIYGIRLIESLRSHQNKKSATTGRSYAIEMEESELHRRDAAVEAIEELLATDPSAGESKRCDEWERRARNDRKRQHDEAQLSSPLQMGRIHTGGTIPSARPTRTGPLLHDSNTDQQSADSSYKQTAGQALTLAAGLDPESGQPQTKRRRLDLPRWLRGSRTG